LNDLLENFMEFVKDKVARQEMTTLIAKSPEMVKFHSRFMDTPDARPSAPAEDPY